MTEKKHYNLFCPLWMSFYAGAIYRDVARRWTGIGASYLALVLLICWSFSVFQMSRVFNVNVNHWVAVASHSLPTITITEGQVSIDENVPYVIFDPDNGKPFLIIDTSANYKPLAETDAEVLLTKNQIFFRNEHYMRIDAYRIPEELNLTIDQQLLANFADNAKIWYPIIVYVVFFVLSYCYRILQALIYGGLIMIFAAITRVKLTYDQALRLALIAVTPAIIIGTIFDFLPDLIPNFLLWIFYFILTVGYLLMAVIANKKPD